MSSLRSMEVIFLKHIDVVIHSYEIWNLYDHQIERSSRPKKNDTCTWDHKVITVMLSWIPRFSCRALSLSVKCSVMYFECQVCCQCESVNYLCISTFPHRIVLNTVKWYCFMQVWQCYSYRTHKVKDCLLYCPLLLSYVYLDKGKKVFSYARSDMKKNQATAFVLWA